ncbi:MAG: hypothetical protein RL653_3161 [Pseudomonadota bacterium]|jgi:hypothetical protein
MPLRLISSPAHKATTRPETLDVADKLEPALPDFPTDVTERALAGAEFAGRRALDRVRTVLGSSTAATFASSPADLAPTLRLADQLEWLARSEPGERAYTWRCAQCETRYAVPVVLARPVTIRCDRCSAPVDLKPSTAEGEEILMDPNRSATQQARRGIALFLRESMARSWVVRVLRED